MPRRRLPNIVITGTPGVGKTTTSTLLCTLSADQSPTHGPLKHISVNDLVKSRNLHEGFDDRLQTLIVDEDKVLDELEKEIADGNDEGGWVLDWHVCDLFPERWVDLVVVLRCSDTGVFHDRLAGRKGSVNEQEQEQDEQSAGASAGNQSGGGRGYTGDKLQENIDAEIFGVVAEEAKEGYPGEGRVVELESVKVEDVDENCERILDWVKTWVEDQKNKEADDDDG